MKEYLKLFEGQPASYNTIYRESDHLHHSVDILIKKDRVYGQYTLGLGEVRDLIVFPTKKLGMAPILLKDEVDRP